MSIKTKLMLILVAACGIPLLVFSVLIFSNAEAALKSLRMTQLNTIADLKRDKIESFFAERTADIAAAQSFLNIKRNLSRLSRSYRTPASPGYRQAFRELDDQLKAYQKAYGYLNIMLTGPDGTIVYASNDFRKAYLGRKMADTAFFDEAKKDIYYTDIFKNRSYDDRLEMIAAAPVRDFKGAFIGEFVSEIDMSPIYTLITDTTGLGETGEVLIAKKDGDAVLFLSPLRHRPGAALTERIPFSQHRAYPAHRAVQGENGSGVTIDYAGREVLAAWQYIPLLRWGLVTKIGVDEAFAPVARLKFFIHGAGVVVVLIGIVLALWLSRTLTRPLLSLQRGAEAIAAGDLDHRVGTGAQDEIGQLSRSFDRMADSLVRDIAARKGVQARLREVAETFRAILNATIESVLLIDRAGTVLMCNEVAARRFRRKINEIIGNCIYDFMPPDVAQARKARADAVFRTKEPVTFEDERQGTYFEHMVHPVIDEQGEVASVAIYSRDITARKRSEMEIRTLNDDLNHNVRRLEEANKELEAFSYSVSHDLRSPLRSIAGFSKALAEDHAGDLNPEGRDYLGRILSATQRMGRLIDDLLNLSRMSRAEMHGSRVNLSELAARVAARVRETEPSRQASFVIAPGLFAQGDEHLLTLALENIFGNAWKFTGKRDLAVIEFGATERKGRPVFFVKDNGVGFDAMHANKLFKPFQRLHNGQDYPGTGIGLATVRRIINRHGGSVWIEGEAGKGATVFFTLS